MDVFTKEKRSKVMSGIRSKDTRPEVHVRRLLFAEGFRFRLHVGGLPGRPDIVLKKWRTVVFVNGCFWHAHEGCPRSRIPEDNHDFWEEKLRRNRERDRRDVGALLEAGWRVLIVWECACGKRKGEALSRLMAEFIRSDERLREIGGGDL